MTSPRFAVGVNIAMKIPAADYERTVAFYRDTLRMELEEVDDTGAPTVSRSHTVDFGPCRLWLDQVDTASRSDVWLELRTDDLEQAVNDLERAGTTTCDEIEPLDSADAHWIRNPAGVVHLLAQEAPASEQ